MQSAVEIKRRINAVEQTRKVTSIMQLTASVRTKNAMQHNAYNHHYFSELQKAMKMLLAVSNGVSNPYLDGRSGGRKMYIVIGSQKGMVGQYNLSVLRFAEEILKQNPKHILMTIGRISEAYFYSHGFKIDSSKDGLTTPPRLSRARHIMTEIIERYNNNEIDEAYIIFTSLYGQNKNKPVIRRLLPIKLSDYSDAGDVEALSEIIYNPVPEELFNNLVPQFMQSYIYGVLIQAYTTENYMRMIAMQSATRNADELLKKLRSRYNMVRQSTITREITEIMGASEILTEGEDDND